jgi:hypothetical protein
VARNKATLKKILHVKRANESLKQGSQSVDNTTQNNSKQQPQKRNSMASTRTLASNSSAPNISAMSGRLQVIITMECRIHNNIIFRGLVVAACFEDLLVLEP